MSSTIASSILRSRSDLRRALVRIARRRRQRESRPSARAGDERSDVGAESARDSSASNAVGAGTAPSNARAQPNAGVELEAREIVRGADRRAIRGSPSRTARRRSARARTPRAAANDSRSSLG
jgi:hypothetical protein